MPLGMEVGLSPEDCVIWGPSPLPQKGAEPPPISGPCLKRLNGCRDQYVTWYRGRPRPRRHCVRWGPSSPPQKGTEPLSPQFRPMSIVAKRLDGSRCHLARTWAFVPATLCYMGIQLPSPKKRREPPIFGPFFIVPKRLDASRCHLVWEAYATLC